MVVNFTANLQDLKSAITVKREASLALAEARLDLVLARDYMLAAEEAHQALYLERQSAACAAARSERERKDADWKEVVSCLSSLVDWLDDQMINDHWYYRGIDRVYNAEQALEIARRRSRDADRELDTLLKAFREGLIIDAALL
jgi:hypothetical protein